MEETRVDERVSVGSVHCGLSVFSIFDPGKSATILVLRFISSGITEPHCTTLQTVCSSSNQNTIMARITSRVNSGRRRRYDRTLEGLNGNGGKAAGDAMMLGIPFKARDVYAKGGSELGDEDSGTETRDMAGRRKQAN